MSSRRWFILPFKRWEKETTQKEPISLHWTWKAHCWIDAPSIWWLKKIKWRIIRNNGEALCKNLSLTSTLPLQETHTLLVQTLTHITKNLYLHTTSFCQPCPVLMTLTGNPKLIGCLSIDSGGWFKFNMCSQVVPMLICKLKCIRLLSTMLFVTQNVASISKNPVWSLYEIVWEDRRIFLSENRMISLCHGAVLNNFIEIIKIILDLLCFTKEENLIQWRCDWQF